MTGLGEAIYRTRRDLIELKIANRRIGRFPAQQK